MAIAIAHLLGALPVRARDSHTSLWCAPRIDTWVPATMSDLPLTEGCWARVRLRPGCDGDGKPHHPAEDGARVKVTTLGEPGGHGVRGNYKGAPWRAPNVFPPPGGLGVGRYFAADELVVLPPGQTDPTPADDALRRARLRREILGG